MGGRAARALKAGHGWPRLATAGHGRLRPSAAGHGWTTPLAFWASSGLLLGLLWASSGPLPDQPPTRPASQPQPGSETAKQPAVGSQPPATSQSPASQLPTIRRINEEGGGLGGKAGWALPAAHSRPRLPAAAHGCLRLPTAARSWTTPLAFLGLFSASSGPLLGQPSQPAINQPANPRPLFSLPCEFWTANK